MEASVTGHWWAQWRHTIFIYTAVQSRGISENR